MGLPTAEMGEAEARGEIVLYGCLPPVGEEPEFYCRDCRASQPFAAEQRPPPPVHRPARTRCG